MRDWQNMDAGTTVQLLQHLRDVAAAGELRDNDEMRETVAILHGFGGYHSRLGTEAYVHVFPAAAQAWLLVSGEGLPAFEQTTHSRVVEHCDLAIESIMAEPDYSDARVVM